jgi:hypothetical protein
VDPFNNGAVLYVEDAKQVFNVPWMFSECSLNGLQCSLNGIECSLYGLKCARNVLTTPIEYCYDGGVVQDTCWHVVNTEIYSWSMLTECSLNVHWMFTECSLNVRWMFTECSLNVYWMFTECSLNVHWMFTECSLNVHWMFTECSLNTEIYS